MENMTQVIMNVGHAQMNVKHVPVLMELVLLVLMTETIHPQNVHANMELI